MQPAIAGIALVSADRGQQRLKLRVIVLPVVVREIADRRIKRLPDGRIEREQTARLVGFVDYRRELKEVPNSLLSQRLVNGRP